MEVLSVMYYARFEYEILLESTDIPTQPADLLAGALSNETWVNEKLSANMTGSLVVRTSHAIRVEISQPEPELDRDHEVAAACDALVGAGMSCSLYFCDDCMFANYCDGTCNFCKDMQQLPQQLIWPAFGQYGPRIDGEHKSRHCLNYPLTK
jgi:hypothetical protein